MLHPEAPDLAGAHSGKAAIDGSASAGWIAGRRVTGLCKQACGFANESRLAGGATGRAAPLNRDRREGRQAVWEAGKARARTAGSGKSAQTKETQPSPKRGRAGRAGGGASASAKRA